MQDTPLASMTLDPNLKVCLVCNTAWAIHTYRQGLLRALRSRGVAVTVLAPRDRTFVQLSELGCTCIDLPVASKGTNPLTDLRTLLTLAHWYRRLKPSMVFHYTIKPNIYGSLAARLADVPSIAVTTGLGYVFIQPSLTACLAKVLYRLAFRYPREVWFLNRDDQAAFLASRLLARPERARLLHGEGIDLQEFVPVALPEDDPFCFILIGRLLWDKGVGEYVAAARILRQRYPRARWQLLGAAGVDSPSAIDQAQIDAWRAEGVIDYLGEAHDVRPYIAAASCVVLPSYREGVPRTLLEAGAMARPSIATDVPGCREVVDNEVTGLLCRAHDADDLARTMVRMLHMRGAARQAMGARARAKIAAEFDERAVVAHYFATLARPIPK